MSNPIHWLYCREPEEALPVPVLLLPADLTELSEDDGPDLADRFGVVIDLGGPRTVVAAGLDRLERWFIDGLHAVHTARTGIRIDDALAAWALSHPAVQLLDHSEPGLLWARTTVGDVPAADTAVCWQHIAHAPHSSEYDDLPDPAPLEDHTRHETLSCVVCGRDCADLVDALQRDERPSATAAAVVDVVDLLSAAQGSDPLAPGRRCRSAPCTHCKPREVVPGADDGWAHADDGLTWCGVDDAGGHALRAAPEFRCPQGCGHSDLDSGAVLAHAVACPGRAGIA